MLALKCDKCGAEKLIRQREIIEIRQGDEISEDPVNYFINMPLILVKKIRIDGLREDISRLETERSYVLCDDCINALNEWLDAKE